MGSCYLYLLFYSRLSFSRSRKERPVECLSLISSLWIDGYSRILYIVCFVDEWRDSTVQDCFAAVFIVCTHVDLCPLHVFLCQTLQSELSAQWCRLSMQSNSGHWRMHDSIERDARMNRGPNRAILLFFSQANKFIHSFIQFCGIIWNVISKLVYLPSPVSPFSHAATPAPPTLACLNLCAIQIL